MRTSILLILCALLAAPLAGQVKDGDLIITQMMNTTSTYGGYTMAVNPGTGRWATISPPVPNNIFSWVQMDDDNTNLMVALIETFRFGTGMMMRSDPKGVQTVLGTLNSNLNTSVNGFELDHNGEWILALAGSLWSMQGSTFSTLFIGGISGTWNEMAIDRDPGAPPFVLCNFTQLNTKDVKLFSAYRYGVISTLLSSAGDPLYELAGIELWAETGQYLTCDFMPPQIHLVNKDGSIASSIYAFGANGAKINQDGTAWVIGRSCVGLIDLRSNAVIRVINFFPNAGQAFSLTGIDVYGSRFITCMGSGRPGTSVNIRLSSRRPGDAGMSYVLACSLARRPGIGFGGGERLNLALDNLFLVSAGKNNSLFSKFIGTTDSFGNAGAAVKIPASIPPNTGITVFVGGVIMGTGGKVQTVTNTHWFILS